MAAPLATVGVGLKPAGHGGCTGGQWQGGGEKRILGARAWMQPTAAGGGSRLAAARALPQQPAGSRSAPQQPLGACCRPRGSRAASQEAWAGRAGGPQGALPPALPRQPGCTPQLNEHRVPRQEQLGGRARQGPREPHWARPGPQRPRPLQTPHLLLGSLGSGWEGPEGLGVAGKTGAVAAEPARLCAHGRPLRRAVSGMGGDSQQCISSDLVHQS